MLVLGVIGFLWLGCLIAFVVAARRAPTLDYMSDHQTDRTDEMVAELRRVANQSRGTSTEDNGSAKNADGRKTG